jgi:hypothetical protein
VEVDFDSDVVGEVVAPGRKKQPLVVAAKQSTPPQDLERHFESMVLSSACKPDIYLHPLQDMCAIPSTGNLALLNPAVTSRSERNLRQLQRKVGQFEQNKH